MKSLGASIKHASAICLTALCISAFSGCQQQAATSTAPEQSMTSSAEQQPSNNQEVSEISEVSGHSSVQETSVASGHGIGDHIVAGKTIISLDDVYLTYDIKTNEDHQYPKEGMVFVVCELSLSNSYSEPQAIDIPSVLAPYYDDTTIDLSELRAVYPRNLNGAENLNEKPEMTLFNEKTISGFIIFEAKKDFRLGGIRCSDPYTGLPVEDYFCFENKPVEQSAESSQESEEKPVTTAVAGDLTFRLTGLEDAEVEAYVDTDDFWGIKLSVSNNSDEPRSFSFNDLILMVSGEMHSQLFSSSELIGIPAGGEAEGYIIFAVPKKTKLGTLYYIQRDNGVQSIPLFLIDKDKESAGQVSAA